MIMSTLIIIVVLIAVVVFRNLYLNVTVIV